MKQVDMNMEETKKKKKTKYPLWQTFVMGTIRWKLSEKQEDTQSNKNKVRYSMFEKCV